MNFNSLQFLIFLPIVLLLYWILPHKFRWVLLLIASYYFYMSWNAWLVFAILGTTAVSYAAGRLIAGTQNSAAKKWLLALTVIICLGTLIFFKYFNFLVQSATDFLNLFALDIHSRTLDIILPVGISFYTFQTLSYVIDVYRGETAEKHFGYYALFVSYFPQLVAGPIERSGDLLPQLHTEQKINWEDFEAGFRILLCGFFRKCVVADFCGIFVNNVFNNLSGATGLSVFIASALFCIQMYCDFAGYSEIAMGSARMMGVKLTRNFDRPYLAQSYTEFFRRWHITLNRWFTDYLYIPLGGNRKGKFRKVINTIIVFLLCGLWHGANWTYVLWGLYAGVWVCIEGLLKKPAQKIISKKCIDLNKDWIKLLRRGIMFMIFIPAALIFRSSSVSQIGEALSKISVFDIEQTFVALGIGFMETIQILLCIICMCYIYYFGEYKPRAEYERYILTNRQSGRLMQKTSIYIYVIAVIAVFWLALLANGDVSTFQYFQF